MANSGGSGISDACVFISLALFGVWMKRQKVKNLTGTPSRWGAFFGALSGKYTISNNIPTTTSNNTASGSSPQLQMTAPVPN